MFYKVVIYRNTYLHLSAISDLRDLYGNKIQGLSSLDSNFCNLHDRFLGRKYWYHLKDPIQIGIYVQFQRCTWLEMLWFLFPYKSLKSEIALTLNLLLLWLKLQEVANLGMFFHAL